MQKFDVVIIGGGFSGLSAGALLADAGKKVLVLEKENYAGGRMFCTEYKGQVLDNGVHLFGRMGYLEEIFSRLGKTFPKVENLINTNVFWEGKWQDVSKLYPHAELRRIIGEEILSRSYEQLEELDDIGLGEWVSKKAKSKETHLFFWVMGWLICAGADLSTISAGDTLIFIKEIIEKAGGLPNLGGTVHGGYKVIMESLADAFKERGGELRTNSKVCDVVFKDGQVRGVEVEAGGKILPSQVIDAEFIEAPLVISTLPIWSLFDVVSEDKFPRWYVDWVKNISQKYINVFTVYYGMSKVPMGDEVTVWWVPKLPRTGLPGCFAWLPTYGEAAGQYQLACWLQANWFDGVPGLNLINVHDAKTRSDVRRIFDLFEQDIKEIFPDLEQSCLWKIRHAAPFSIAEVPGTVRRHRPTINPPGVKNFFLISDTLQETRPGASQSSARCVLECVNKILGSK